MPKQQTSAKTASGLHSGSIPDASIQKRKERQRRYYNNRSQEQIEYRRKYQREWVQKRRLEYEKPCEICGCCEDVQLHHKDPNSKVEHRIFSWSRKRLEAELKKCVWLCRGCHWNTHRALSDSKPCNGTTTNYKKGCRCNVCCEAKRQEKKRAEYRKTHG